MFFLVSLLVVGLAFCFVCFSVFQLRVGPLFVYFAFVLFVCLFVGLRFVLFYVFVVFPIACGPVFCFCLDSFLFVCFPGGLRLVCLFVFVPLSIGCGPNSGCEFSCEFS